MPQIKRTSLLLVGAAVTFLATFASLTVGRAESLTGAAAAPGIRTYVFRTDGKRVGYVKRLGERGWLASNNDNSTISVDRKGGYWINEGIDVVRYAWPKPPGQRSFYVVRDYAPPGRFPPTGETLRRVSATRWNVFRRSHLIAFTQGPDGVAAGLAYVVWGNSILPH